MKTSDYVSVGFISIFVTILAYILVNSILGDPSEASVRFEYLNYTNAGIATPDNEVFNAGAINPTVEVYVGSCKDKNGDGGIDEKDYDQDDDGVISEWERRICGTVETNTGVTESEQYLEANKGLSNAENDAINNAEGYANGTTAEQRQAVKEDVEQYQQQQQQQQQAEQNSASRETVSGG